MGDVEPRVAQMALRCLRQKDLAENLKSEEFELVVNLVIGSRDMAVSRKLRDRRWGRIDFGPTASQQRKTQNGGRV